jgi:hypothetical protein
VEVILVHTYIHTYMCTHKSETLSWKVKPHTHAAENLIHTYTHTYTHTQVGNIILEQFIPIPPVPKPIHTELNLVDWEATIKGKDSIVLTWLHTQEELALQVFGAQLTEAFARENIPKAIILKAQHELERDEWFQNIRAACAWARAQVCVYVVCVCMYLCIAGER